VWGTICRGGFGGILYCGALDGLFSALQGVKSVRWGTQMDSEVALRACAWHACKRGCTGTLVVVLRGLAVFIARPVTDGRTRVRFALVIGHPPAWPQV
jgi:hypothetical protein